MKVRWLNEELTRAELVRGFWRWRRHTVVHQVGSDWLYPDGSKVPANVGVEMRWKEHEEKAERQDRSNWRAQVELPNAKVVS
jgi:hypothetical protein